MHEQQQTITPDIREIDPHAPHYIQSRAQMDFALVDEYAQMMRDGVEFDPAQGVVDLDGTGAIYIYDGYHRGEAAKAAGVTLRVMWQSGTRADAEWLAFAANKSHGLRRTHADIERVVKNALAHPNAAQMSDRELARHCGTDHKTVGNWRRRLADAGKRKNESGEIPRVPTPDAPLDLDAAQRAQAEAVIAQAQALLDAPQPTQTDIAEAERPEYTLAEIQKVVEGYLPTDATDRASVLNNLISKTIAGQAYEREIESLLRSNPTRSCEQLNASLRIIYGLIINALPSADAENPIHEAREGWICAACHARHSLNESGYFYQDGRAICEYCHRKETAQQQLAPEIAAELKPQPEAAPDDMPADAPIPNLEMIGKCYRTPYGVGRINGIMQDGSFNAEFQSEFGSEIRNLKPEELLKEAREFSAPEMQMRCAGCRAQFPASQLTYKTGLCPACLAYQIEILYANNRTMRATFNVLDRMLTDGLAAEIKREIYEEMYAPTP